MTEKALKTRKYFFFRKASILISLFLGAIVPTHSQETMRIAALVNDEIITVRDLENRMQILIVGSNVQPKKSGIKRLANQVLQILVDEKLKFEAAQKRRIFVTNTEFLEAVTILERRNKIAPGRFRQYLMNQGLDWHAMSHQIRAQILWAKMVKRILLPSIVVSDNEISGRIEQLNASLDKREYKISEILLSSGKSERRSLTREDAERLVRDIGNGADFSVFAGQFSDATSAPFGGDIGWQRIENLPPFIRPHLLKMGPGDVSGPIEFPDGFYIIQVNKVRMFGDKNEETEEVNLRRMFFSDVLNGSPGDRKTFAQRLENIRKSISSCDQFDQVAKKFGFNRDTKLGNLKLKELSSEIVKAIRTLPIGQPSLPVLVGNNVAIFSVCQRLRSSPSPNREEVRQKILKEKLDILARRFLRDMRANAIIDIRI